MPAFIFRNDFQSVEIKRSAGGTIQLWPSVDGVGPVQVTAAVCAVKQVNQTLLNPTVTITDAVSAGVTGSQLQVTIPAGLPYTYTYNPLNDYRAEFEWTWSGGIGYTTVPFDVVYQPWGNSTVQLDDLVSVSLAASGVLGTMADQLEVPITQVASQFAAQAHSTIDDWLREKATADGEVRGRAILEKARIHRVETQLALALMWRSVMKGDPNDNATRLHEVHMADARASFNALGNLRYDANEDGAIDSVITSLGRSIRLRRTRG
jgi:hypothetical protein